MRILLKCPTRGRRDKFLETIRTWVAKTRRTEALGIAVSLDTDDASMADFTEADLPAVAWKKVFRNPNKTKIQACNADMDRIDWPWDVVILVSDDMVPEVQDYDERLREVMTEEFDKVIWVHDGLQNERLNTLSILGRKIYDQWGYIYNPEYKSFYCDNEFTDWCKANSSKCAVIPEVLIRHKHPLATGEPFDALYTRNQAYLDEDRRTYERRTAPQKMGFLKLLSRR